MVIREANISDLERIIEFNYNLALETEGKVLDKEILAKGVGNALQDNSKAVYHVCVKDSKVIGQIMYTYEWSDWRNGTFLWVQSVYVDKEYRGQGVFKSLYNYVKSICYNNSNLCGIRLYVERENTVAQKTYKSLGMEECNYFMYEYEK